MAVSTLPEIATWSLSNLISLIYAIYTKIQMGCMLMVIHLCYHLVAVQIGDLKRLVTADVDFKAKAFDSGWIVMPATLPLR